MATYSLAVTRHLRSRRTIRVSFSTTTLPATVRLLIGALARIAAAAAAGRARRRARFSPPRRRRRRRARAGQNDESSEARNRTALAISSGVPMRLSGPVGGPRGRSSR
jgi:hypothetical protein